MKSANAVGVRISKRREIKPVRKPNQYISSKSKSDFKGLAPICNLTCRKVSELRSLERSRTTRDRFTKDIQKSLSQSSHFHLLESRRKADEAPLNSSD